MTAEPLPWPRKDQRFSRDRVLASHWPAWDGGTWARVEVFEKSGHQPFVEEPEKFVELVTGWVG